VAGDESNSLGKRQKHAGPSFDQIKNTANTLELLLKRPPTVTTAYNDPDASKSAVKLPCALLSPCTKKGPQRRRAQVVDQLSWDKEGFATARSQVRCVLWEVCIFVVTGCSGAHFKACQWTCEPITSLTFLIQHHVLQRLCSNHSDILSQW